jgi:hypothetical protein
MPIANGNPEPAATQATFFFDGLHGRSLSVERLEKHWKLSVNGRALETRDLTSGIDELFGKSSANVALVLRILEWQAGSA